MTTNALVPAATSTVERYRAAENVLFAEYGLAPRERTVRVDALDLSVRVIEVGSSDGPAIVYLHGAPNAGAVWSPLVARLPGFRHVLVDLIGFGLSERPARAIAARDYAAPLLPILDACAIDRAHLAVSSFGSGVAVRFALDHATRVGRIIHFGCPGVLPASPAVGMGMLMSLIGSVMWMRIVGPSEKSVAGIWRAIGHDRALAEGRFPPEILRWYAALMRNTRTRQQGDAVTKAVMKGFRVDTNVFATADELARVAAPSSLFWGTADRFGGADAARALQALIPGAQLELLEGGGHLPWLDDAERAARHVSAFLA